MTAADQPSGEVPRWRKRPVTVEARQFSIGEPVRSEADASEGNGPELAEWCGGRYFPAERSLPACVLVQSLEGPVTASPGDWIVKGSRGEFWPVRSDIFAEDYEAVTEPPAVPSAAGNAEAVTRAALAAQSHVLHAITRWAAAAGDDPVVAPWRAPEERCKHDMLRSQCGDCTGRTGTQRPAPDTAGYGPWFTAGRHSRCAGPCDERIKPGDRIRADGEHGYLCETCGQDSNSP